MTPFILHKPAVLSGFILKVKSQESCESLIQRIINNKTKQILLLYNSMVGYSCQNSTQICSFSQPGHYISSTKCGQTAAWTLLCFFSESNQSVDAADRWLVRLAQSAVHHHAFPLKSCLIQLWLRADCWPRSSGAIAGTSQTYWSQQSVCWTDSQVIIFTHCTYSPSCCEQLLTLWSTFGPFHPP